GLARHDALGRAHVRHDRLRRRTSRASAEAGERQARRHDLQEGAAPDRIDRERADRRHLARDERLERLGVDDLLERAPPRLATRPGETGPDGIELGGYAAGHRWHT